MDASTPPSGVPVFCVGSCNRSPVLSPTDDHQDYRRVNAHHVSQDTPTDMHSCSHDNQQDASNIQEVSRSHLTTLQIITLIILMAGNVSSAMFSSLLAPFFPTQATKMGATLYEVGLIFGVYQLIQFVMSPIFGMYLTKLGSKYLFVAGNVLVSGCAIMFGMLEWCPHGVIYIVMCFVVRSVEALGSAASMTATYTIGAVTFPRHISTVMGLLQAASCLGLVAGPPAGGLLFSIDGFYLPFLVTGCLFMFFCLISLFILPSTESEHVSRQDSRLNVFRLMRRPVVLVVGYMVLIGQATMGFVDVALAEYLDHIQPGISKVSVGLIFLIPAAIVVMLSPVVGLITDRHKSLCRPFMIIGTVVGGGSFLLIGPSPCLPFLTEPSVHLVITSLAVSALGWSCLMLTYQEFIKAAKKHHLPDTLEMQGIISGVNGAFSSLGALLGPTLGGVMYEKLQFPWASTVVAFAVLFSALLFILYIITEVLCRQHHTRTRDTECVMNSEHSPLLS